MRNIEETLEHEYWNALERNDVHLARVLKDALEEIDRLADEVNDLENCTLND